MVGSGLGLALLAVLLAVLKVRALDAVERATVLETPAFSVGSDGSSLALGAHAVPAGGLLRVRACVSRGEVPTLRLGLRDARGAMVAELALDHEQSASARCTEARWPSATARAPRSCVPTPWPTCSSARAASR